MKKKLLFILVVLFPLLALNAQKIEKDYYDQFTGKRVMFTKLQKVNLEYSDRIGGKMQFRFVLNDDFQYLVIYWNTKKFLQVDADALVQFKLDNGHLINLKNETTVVASVGGTKVSKKDVGVAMNCIGDVAKFASAQVVALRIHTSEGYFDFEIGRKDAIKLHKMYLLFNKQTYISANR